MRGVKIAVGMKVRIVEMNGCMANDPNNCREGIVVGRITKDDIRHVNLPLHERTYYQVKVRGGGSAELSVAYRHWVLGRDNIPEYRE